MTPTQRRAALRLADERPTSINDDLLLWATYADGLLRELAAESQGEPVAWPARHVSLKQRKDKTLRLTLDLNAVEGWPNYWVMRSDSRGKCSTPSGCAAHGCHGECLQTPPQQRRPLTDEQIANRIWESDWPEVMLSDFVKAKLRVLARNIEKAHGITGEPE